MWAHPALGRKDRFETGEGASRRVETGRQAVLRRPWGNHSPCGFDSRRRHHPGSVSGRQTGSEPVNGGSNPPPGSSRRGAVAAQCLGKAKAEGPSPSVGSRRFGRAVYRADPESRRVNAPQVRILQSPPAPLVQWWNASLTSKRQQVRFLHGAPALVVKLGKRTRLRSERRKA